MQSLTKKQANFVAWKLKGLNNKDAVIEAGYSHNGAKQAATRLMRNSVIRSTLIANGYDGLNRLQSDMQRITRNLRKVIVGGPIPYQGMPKQDYQDAKEFLFDGMNNRSLPLTVRAAFAASLLPYFHSKLRR